jgi:hypothetical protein
MRRSIIVVVLALAPFGCKKGDDKAAASASSTEPTNPVTTEPPKVEPAKPAKAAYTPEAAKAQVAELAKCSSRYGCAAFDALVGFGPAAAPDLVTVAVDDKAPIEQRRVAVAALGELKAPDVGLKLIESANKLDDSLAQGDFYEAAGKSGGQPVFDALIAEYGKASASLDDNREIPLRHGLKAFPKETVAWAKDALPKAKNQTAIADLVDDVATDQAVVLALLPTAKDPMAKHRLAKKAIELGATDPKLWDVFLAGLASADQYDRSDAGNFLASVAKQVPAELKPKFVALLKKALAGPKDPMLNGGLEKSLETLGG